MTKPFVFCSGEFSQEEIEAVPVKMTKKESGVYSLVIGDGPGWFSSYAERNKSVPSGHDYYNAWQAGTASKAATGKTRADLIKCANRGCHAPQDGVTLWGKFDEVG